MAKGFQKEMTRKAETGFSLVEIAFYDALADNESVVRKLGDEILKKITIEITNNPRKSTEPK